MYLKYNCWGDLSYRRALWRRTSHTHFDDDKNGISGRLREAARKKQKPSRQASALCRKYALQLISEAESDETYEGT